MLHRTLRACTSQSPRARAYMLAPSPPGIVRPDVLVRDKSGEAELGVTKELSRGKRGKKYQQTHL